MRRKQIRIFQNDSYQHSFRSQPLHSRGWTLQERELSPRLLFYTTSTIRWECSSLRASIRFPWDDTLSFSTEVFDLAQSGRWRDLITSSFNSNTKGEEEREEGGKEGKDIVETTWQLLACKFQDRKLTFQTDILPGISGMAKLVHKSTSDTYLAGLWKATLLRGLLWESNWDSNFTTIRHTEYLAPAWSWASIVGPISYHEYDSSSSSTSQSLLPSEKSPEILKTYTEPEGPDPFGRLKSGFIELKGTLKKAKTKIPRNDGYNVLPVLYISTGAKVGEFGV